MRGVNSKANHRTEREASLVKHSPVVFSFFAGAGFLDLGFEKTGYEIVLVNEIHPSFLQCYKHSRAALGLYPPRFGYNLGDVSSFLNGEQRNRLRTNVSQCRTEGRIVGFIGGPPCPDFSVGGKNLGRDGDHGRLSETYADLICKEKPDFFVFENVKGLWRTKKHRTFFEELKKRFRRNGYATTQRLINVIEYGVPQDRERIILIGFHKTLLGKRYLKQCDQLLQHNFLWDSHTDYEQDLVFSLPWPTVDPFRIDSLLIEPPGIIRELTVEHWFRKNAVSVHPNARDCFEPKAGLRFTTVYEGDVSKRSFKRLHRWRYSPTACYGNNEVHLHPYKARRLSVAEALALQSLPKEYCLPTELSLSAKFKAIGNGVPYLAAKGIALSILDFLEVVKRE